MTYMLWFNIIGLNFVFVYFKLIIIYTCMLPYPKTKGNRIQIKDKIEPKHIQPCLFEAENVDVLRSMTFPGNAENKLEELSQSRIGVSSGDQWIKALYL